MEVKSGGALVGGGSGAAAVSVWDKINDTKADIQKVESTVQEAKAGVQALGNKTA